MAIPCAILFSLVAHPLVRLVYGSKWDAAIPLLPYALAGGTAGALYQAATMLMLADVQHRGCAVAEFLTLASLVVCLFTVLPHGIAAYLGAVAVVQAAVLVWMLWSAAVCRERSRSRAVMRGVLAPDRGGHSGRLVCAAVPRARFTWAGGRRGSVVRRHLRARHARHVRARVSGIDGVPYRCAGVAKWFRHFIKKLCPAPLKQKIKLACGAPDTDACLAAMKGRGFHPKTAIDIGAYSGEWTLSLRALFPETRVLMVEPQARAASDCGR